MAQMVHARQQIAEGLAVIGHAADGNAAKAGAVIAALAADQHRARSLAAGAVIGERDLERTVHGFGAGIGEKYMVETGRRERGDFLRRLECLGMPHLKGGREVELVELGLHRVDDFRASVTGIHAPQAGRPV